MTMVNTLSLNEFEKQSLATKIKGRVTESFNLAADFANLRGMEVDFSVLNPDKVTKMENAIGKQYTIPVKTFEGLDGEVSYTELNDDYFYNVTTKTKQPELLNRLRQTAKANKKLEPIEERLTEQGYTIKKDEEYVLQNEKAFLEKGEKKVSSESANLFTLPIYKNGMEVGSLAVDGVHNTPVAVIGEERTFFHEDEGVVTIQAEACSLTWTQCMARELGGCHTWSSCLMIYGGCVVACCGCLNPISCAGCMLCAIHVINSAWTCRMCVYGASRPWECPTA